MIAKVYVCHMIHNCLKNDICFLHMRNRTILHNGNR